MLAVAALAIFFCAFTGPTQTLAQGPLGDLSGESSSSENPEKKNPEPPVYTLPEDAPAIMKIVDEKITASDLTGFFKSKDYRKYRIALRGGNLGPAARALIQKGIRIRVLRMSLVSERLDLYKRRVELTRDLRDAARQQSDTAVARQFREFVLGEVTKNCRQLLDNALHVRINAAIVLSNLNVRPPNSSRRILPIAYVAVAEVLISIISDKKQHDAVKIWAARGLWHVSRFGDPRLKIRLNMSAALIAELSNPKAHMWYQWRLVQALGAVNQPLDRDGRPANIRMLLQVLLDSHREWIVRSAAAKAIGRAPLDRQTNVSVLATEIVNLARKMADAHNRKPKAPYWKQCYLDLYLAFHYRDDFEKKHGDGLLAKVQQAPLAARHKNFVAGAYRQLLPMVNHVIRQGGVPFPRTILTPVSDWLKTNSKGTLQVHPGLPPITNTQQTSPPTSPAG